MALGAIATVFMTGGCAYPLRGLPAAHGIANFGQVNGTLYRGAQPDEGGIENLQRMGVATIINLRMPGDAWTGEAESARRHGMAYGNVPLRGLSAPSDAQVAQVLSLLETSRPPVFIHCEHGADRTGTIVACYRMQHDGWTTEQAMAEAHRHGLSELQFGMKHYLRNYRPKPGVPAKPATSP